MLTALHTQLTDYGRRQAFAWIASSDTALALLLGVLRDACDDGAKPLLDQARFILPRESRTRIDDYAAQEYAHRRLTQRALSHLPVQPARHTPLAPVVTLTLQSAKSPEEVARAFLLCYALKRRVCTTLAQVRPEVSRRHPALAPLLDEILDDTVRHVAWCAQFAFQALGQDYDKYTVAKQAMIEAEAALFAGLAYRNLQALASRPCTVPQRLCFGALAWWMSQGAAVSVNDPDGVLERRPWTPVARRRQVVPQFGLWA